jgi:hypothetical protein
MKQRRRIKQSFTLEERLAEEAQRLREEAEKQRPGSEREALLRKARQNENMAHLTEWLTSQPRSSNYAAHGEVSPKPCADRRRLGDRGLGAVRLKALTETEVS